MAKAPKKTVAIYKWDGKNRAGKSVMGEMEGPSPAYISATLRRQGITPGKVRKKPKEFMARAKKITPKDVAIFTRQLATMIAAGIPIAQGVDIISKGHDNPSMRTQLTSIRQDLEAGTSLSNALKKFPIQYDDLYTNLVESGEQSGTLEAILDKVASYKEKIEAIKGKVKAALFYPASIIVVAILVSTILLVFVIPQFEALFQGFGADLPALTAMVIGVSKYFQESWFVVFAVMIGVVVGTTALYKRSEKMRFFIDRMSLKIPVVGEILKKATIARFSRTLATMFAAGVPLVDALNSVAGASGNRVYYNGVMEIKDQVSTGTHLEPAMAGTNLFPNMVLQMVAIGEESGELDAMLNKVADFYESEVDDAVAAMSSLLEPLIMVFLGVIIGTMVIAMYLPIFKMAAVF